MENDIDWGDDDPFYGVSLETKKRGTATVTASYGSLTVHLPVKVK